MIGMFINGLLNAIAIGFGIMIIILLGAAIYAIIASMGEVISEDSSIKHPYIIATSIFVGVGLILSLTIKLFLMLLPLLWFLLKIALVISVIFIIGYLMLYLYIVIKDRVDKK